MFKRFSPLSLILVTGAFGCTFLIYFLSISDSPDVPVTIGNSQKPFLQNSDLKSSLRKELQAFTVEKNPDSILALNLSEIERAIAFDKSGDVLNSSLSALDALSDNLTIKEKSEAGKILNRALPLISDAETKQSLSLHLIDLFSELLSVDSSSADYKTQLAVAYVEGASDPMKGIMLLRQVAEKEPDFEDAQLYLGDFSMKSGQYQKAIDRYMKVLEINSKKFIVHLHLSEAYLNLGNKKKASEHLAVFLANSEVKRMNAYAGNILNNINN